MSETASEVIFWVVLVAVIVAGPLSPLAFCLYWLLGGIFVLAVIFKGVMFLLDRSYQREMRKLHERHELYHKQLTEAHRRERALRGPDCGWRELDRMLGTNIAEIAAQERALKSPHRETDH